MAEAGSECDDEGSSVAAGAAAAGGGETVVGFMDWGFFVCVPRDVFLCQFFFGLARARRVRRRKGVSLMCFSISILVHIVEPMHDYPNKNRKNANSYMQ